MKSKKLLVLTLLSTLGTLTFSGCRSEGCLRGDEGCQLPPVCEGLAFECDDESVELFVAQSLEQIPGGQEAAGKPGDFILRNSAVVFVLDAIDNPNYVSTTGGMVLDATTRGDDNDSINHIFSVTGALPTDAVVYTSVRTIETGVGVALQYEGHLQGDIRQRVYTRYELRPCDLGLRVRTEMVNNATDDAAWMNGDAYWWGGRQNQPFAPVTGIGYVHPSFGLSTLNDAVVLAPYMAASYAADTQGSAVATIPCNIDNIEMLNSESVSLAGTPRRIVTASDYVVYERFHAVGKGSGVAPATDVALEVRKQLFDESYVTLSGTVSNGSGPFDVNRAQIHIAQGRSVEPLELRTPITTLVPNDDGTYEVRVPSNNEYTITLVSFGRTNARQDVQVGEENLALEDMALAGSGELIARVQIDGAFAPAQLWVFPADDDAFDDTAARFNGIDEECAPLLGYPYGQSPACNRVLTNANEVGFRLPEGEYVVYAHAGPFTTLAKQVVRVENDSNESIEFALTTLDLLPPNTLSADFHVHGSASFDSSIPHDTRVRSFLSQRVDVIAATDHDAIFNYAETIANLGITPDDMILLTGLETTGFILNNYNPDVSFPQVVGHWIFWPLTYSPERPRNGAPFDELAEPAEIFARVKQADFPEHGVIQLNHPWSDTIFGRDLGWPRAIGMNLNEPLPKSNDGTGPGLFTNRPLGVEFRNSDYHAQEVMNGTESLNMFAHRAVWFYLLNEGFLKAGTANSDSHSLLDNTVGSPRTLVKTPTQKGAGFDIRVFNANVKDGNMTGTSGPVIDMFVTDGDALLAPSLTPHRLSQGAQLTINVKAAPWIPVSEVRVLVNGEIVRTFEGDELTTPTDAFGVDGLERLNVTIDVDPLLENTTSDAFIVVEAGDPIPLMGDLNCDGVPDTLDHNEDGVVDWRDTDDEEEPAECEGSVGNLDRPEDRLDYTDDENAYSAVTDNRLSFSFTNPIVFDLNGNGFGGTR